MADASKCAHPSCQCTVTKSGPYGSTVVSTAKQAGQQTELGADASIPSAARTYAV